MPLRETTVVFSDKIEEYEQEQEELADEVADLSESHPEYERKVERGKTLDTYIDGLEWARDHAHEDDDVPAWDDDVDAVTLQGMATGDIARLKKDIREAASQSEQDPSEATQVYQVRAGTVDAPYVGDDMTLLDEVAAVASLPASFTRFVEDQIDELSSVGNGERKTFEQLVAEKRTG